jgi:hypothetical protein
MDDTNSFDAEYTESIDDSAPSDAADAAEDVAWLDDASNEYLGRWNRLVSTTNWEKGRIISQWRSALVEASAPSSAYTDEAWAVRVGNVTPQHVGRLRRVFDRFGAVFTDYPGLYWSHFQAALDWHDAEMWLEGAVQNDWSVAGMRNQRWQAAGALAADEPQPGDIVSEELDADAPVPLADSSAEPLSASSDDTVRQSMGEVRDPSGESDDDAPFDTGTLAADQAAEPTTAPVRPFENLPTLPPDLAEPYESLKLAILAHKVAGWTEISCGEVLAALNALKQLALAPQ